MKIARLLVVGALFLLGNNVAKAVDGNVWTKPAAVTEFASLVDGEVYYFYNTGSQLFFTQGNLYGTQASVGETGLKVRVEMQWEGVYTLTDYVKTQEAWKMWWFVDTSNIMYVDYNNQPDFLWEITAMGNDVYRLSPSAQNPNWNDNTKFVGLDRTTDPTNTVLTSDNTADGGAFIDWKLVPEAAGEAYEAKMEAYQAAMALKEQLDKAEAIGAAVADQVAVYNNTNSTKEELQAATEATKKAIQTREEELAIENYPNATVSNPVNVTKLFIQNPSFDGNVLTGWSGSGWGSYDPKENAERFSMNFDTYQELTDLREGVYMFNVHAFYRAGNTTTAYTNYKAQNEASKYAKIYATNSVQTIESSIASPYTAGLTAGMTTGTWTSATDEETGETYFIPNNMIAADEFFAAGYCNDNHVFINVNDGKLKVGARKSTTTSDDWAIFDDFSLTYYGDSDEAYKLMLEDVNKNLKDYSNLADAIYTQSYYDAYNAAVEATKAATTKETILSAIDAIQTASTDLEENISLWQQISDLRKEAIDCAADEYLDEEFTGDVGDWGEFEAEDLLKKHDMSNEELKAEIERVREMINDAYQHLMPNADVTNKFLVNPDYSKGKDGWTQEAVSGGNVAIGGTATNTCYEAWNNGNFDIYQIVKSAPKGVYEISVQGFYRYGRGGAYQSYLNHEQYTTKETCPVFIYLNSNSTPFTNIFGDPQQITEQEFYSANSTDYSSETDESTGTTYYFPNGMASAAIAFENGMYTQSAYGLVSQDGQEIRIGVKGSSNQLGDSWCIWDNFHLYYRGFQADVVKPVLEQAITDGENSLNSAIGKDVVANLEAAIDEAKAVVNGEDGEAMFAALTKLFDMQDAVNASKKLFAELEAANEKLADALRSAVATSATINEANALNSDINAGLENHSYADTEVEGLIDQINTMINRLGIPQNMEMASDANPVECTTIIINPAYVDGNDNGWTGQAAVNGTALDAEKYNTNYNYFQVLRGLPEGTYKVSVTGFYRAGNPDVDYSSWVENPELNNNAFLYAAEGTDTVSVPLYRLATKAQPTDAEEPSDGWAWASQDNKLVVPHSMTTAGDMFQSVDEQEVPYFSNNNVIVKVGQEGILTIGLKKDVLITNDWTLWTNWQLFYYGKNSQLAESDNPMSIEAIAAGQVSNAEVFSVNGTRVNGLQRGINIVRETLSDGTVRVRKVSVK